MVQWAPNQPLSFAEPEVPSRPPATKPVRNRSRSQGQQASAGTGRPLPPTLLPTYQSPASERQHVFEPGAGATPPSASSTISSSTTVYPAPYTPPAAAAAAPLSPHLPQLQPRWSPVPPPPEAPPWPGSVPAPRETAAPLPLRGNRDSPRPPPLPLLQPRTTAPPPQPRTPPTGSSTSSPPLSPATANDIAALAARFTNKPVPDGYEQEARATLLASQSEPAVRHALASLRSLYATLEDHGHEFPDGRLAVPTVYHGLQEYHNAIVNLTDKLAVMDRRSCEVALVCCRLFISIETMQRDYVSVAEHYVRGMRIMHEAATRPYLDARGNVTPTQNGDFPKIDMFIIKIFMSPCRMAPACRTFIPALFRSAATRRTTTTPTRQGRRGRERGRWWRHLSPHESMRVLRLARNEVRAARLKARLNLISELCLHHLDNVARLRPGSDASRVVAEREVLLRMLDDVRVEGRDGERDLGPYHGRFYLLYHCALRIAVLLSLWAPTQDIAALQPIFDRAAEVARRVI